MQTAQTRTTSRLGILVAVLLGAVLFLAIGLLAMSGAIDTPVGGQEGPRGKAAADPPAAGESPITGDHRYFQHLADGGARGASPARYQGPKTAPPDRSNHRYFAGKALPAGDEGYPENHRISQLVE